MAKFKELCGTIWKWVWECFKRSLLPLIMYISASVVICMFTLDQVEIKAGLTTARFWTIFGIALFAVVYGALMAFVEGGAGYDMLVAGNMKRMLSEKELKMTSHKVQREYRTWKGFAIGAWMVVLPLICALIFGANQDAILTSEDGGILFIKAIGMFVTGWAIYPFYFANFTGFASVSYYWSLLLLILPILVSGVMYIVGAYARRNKAIKEQELADRAAKVQENKVKKINYGGLPGTKPRKRK